MSADAADRTERGGQVGPLLTAMARTCPAWPASDTDDGRNQMETPTPNKRRMLRRLRAEFRQELGVENPTRAERVLVELAALTTLRARGMRDQIIDGQEPDDEDFVRIVRATTSIIKAFKEHRAAKQRDVKPKTFEERMAARDQKERKEFDANDF
jgi:hypothetical protein